MSNEVANRNLLPGDHVIVRQPEQSGFEMRPRTLEEAMRFCDIMSKSDLVPKDYKDKPGNIMVAIQLGGELGLTPFRALRSIAVINGRASMWGDDVLAMVLASPVCEYVDESESTDKQGVCRTKRKGCKEQVSIYTIADAQAAGLLGKAGTWQTNRPRMLKMRARGFGLRDNFADVLAGLITAEEAMDLPKIEPEDTKTNILEASQPLTLKDKLRAKVEQVEGKDTVQGDGLNGTSTAKKEAVEPNSTASQDAPASLSIGDACFSLEQAQTAKEYADTMNSAMACDYTPEERKKLQDNAAVAKKRLGIK